MSESPPMNAKMDVAAIRMFNGTKNTPTKHSAARALSVWCSQGGQGGQRATSMSFNEKNVMRAVMRAQSCKRVYECLRSLGWVGGETMVAWQAWRRGRHGAEAGRA